MSYTVEEITPNDRSKILSDSQAFPKLHRLLERTGYFESEHIPLKWAIDRESGSYLLSAPRPLPEPTMDTYYLFYVDPIMLQLQISGAFGQLVKICNPEILPLTTRQHVCTKILEAFAKYGRFGDGVAGDLKVTKVFVEDI